jgi:hypothetical protein
MTTMSTTLSPAGTRVRVHTTNGAQVEGTLLYEGGVYPGSFGCHMPVVETDDGKLYSYRNAAVRFPSGRWMDGIPGAVAMEVL